MKLKIISDGTNAGTKLIDEDTGEMIHLIQKLTWEANAEDLTKITVELINIPVEIVSKAEVDIFDYDIESCAFQHVKTVEKEIKIISEQKDKNFALCTKILDTQTNEQVSAIQEVKWEATPEGTQAKVKKIKFDKKDWQ